MATMEPLHRMHWHQGTTFTGRPQHNSLVSDWPTLWWLLLAWIALTVSPASAGSTDIRPDCSVDHPVAARAADSNEGEVPPVIDVGQGLSRYRLNGQVAVL